MASYLVTGASGLIGSHLIRHLAKEHHVISLGRRSPETEAEHIQVDLSEPGFTNQISTPPDYVIHLAQSEHYRAFPQLARDVFQVNTASTLELLDFCVHHQVKGFLYASTGAVYSSATQPYKEDLPLPSNFCKGNFYAASKLASEAIANAYRSLLNIVTLRYFFVYGPGQRQSMLIATLIDRLSKNIPITLHGDDGFSFNPLFVEDAVHLSLKALHRGNRPVYNLAGKEIISLRSLTDTLGRLLDCQPRYEIVDQRPHDCIAEITAMKQDLGDPSILLEEGLKQQIEARVPTHPLK